MIADKSLLQLEFNKLLMLIAGFIHSEATNRAVLCIRPFQERGAIENRFGRIREIGRISQENNPLKLSEFSDISEFISRSRPDGAVLDGIELSAFIPVLSIAYEISAQISDEQGLPFLYELTSHLTGHPELLKQLRRSIDSEGKILDTASALLKELRDRKRRLESNILKRLEELMRESSTGTFLQDDFITQRSGRWVIPVRMDSKGQVPGVVHDVSKSGETAFIEPLGILHLSNELENSMADEKAEEIRILRELSAQVRESADEIGNEFETIVQLDLLYCIARTSDLMNMEIPAIGAAGRIHIVQGKHPLLLQSLLKADSGQMVVPLDVTLDGENTIMAITGSNAGGKTIALKTIGLLTVMALSGMPVPAAASSVFPFILKLLIDIGDEQSIENNLSTFSAHVSHISGIIRDADEQSMVLIDELGTGTDPDEGAALSCAVLKEIQQKKAQVFTTTHLTGIKGFVHRTSGMINASMEFDRSTLTPLYRLRTGEPGQSHALDIAKRYGMPDSVISSARELMGGISIEFDNLIADLSEQRAAYEDALADLSGRKMDIERKEKELEERMERARLKQEEILGNAYREASEIVSNLKRELHLRLQEIRKADREKTREEIRQAEKMQRELQESLSRLTITEGETVRMEEIAKGDVLYLKSLGYDATVTEVLSNQRRLRLRAGSMEVEVPVSDIARKKGTGVVTGAGEGVTTQYADEEVSTRVRLVGLRVDEALSTLEPFLNHAALAGFHEVIVIHGIGKGLLARAVREHLHGHPLVESYRKGEQSEGGAGVTVVTLR